MALEFWRKCRQQAAQKWSLLAAQLLSVRARVFFWYLLLLSGFLLLSLPIMLKLVADDINTRVQKDLREDIKLFQDLLRDDAEVKSRLGITETSIDYPDTPIDLIELFNLYLARRVPEDDTFLIGIIGEDFYRSSPEALPKEISASSKLIRKLSQTNVLMTGLDPYPNSVTGDILYKVLPIQNSNREILGRFIVVHAVAGEQQEALSSLNIVFLTLLGVFALSILVSAAIAGRVLSPLKTILAVSRDINESNLTKRIPISTKGELADLAQSINSMMDRLERAFRDQRQFLNDAGHELRTPITIIQGHLELLDTSTLPPEDQETMALVLDELGRMGRMVQDLSLLAKSERPDFLRLESIDLKSFTSEVFQRMISLTAEPRQWQFEATVQGQFIGDRQRLIQALLNLAQNAVQHTQLDDLIGFGAQTTAQSLCFWVQDTGEGIRAEDQIRIFERFEQGHQRTRNREGSGLGLSIVQTIAKAHGGRITVESEPDHGAKFVMTLPLKSKSVRFA
ncbi:sensor histidine kinase [Lyngbya confervoides]|uniref:histidine kinase n=1 Tax=Lyngbya confervoides BDU141951 TaxID=1574623 RepID=A0ABD4T746_9CYAN|nr:HAMP domain-containing sensor histidine kinase [Lyngbya confervoides]MCM1984466.1 HAMP domain-containing histidine kinase [Lyngbya confervoides BDU141951]